MNSPCIQCKIFLFNAVFETIDNYIFIFFSYEHVNPFYNSQTYKICLSFSLNFYLRLMETKYNEGMNYASWRLAFCFSKHKYAIHKSKAAYLRQIGGRLRIRESL